MHTHHTRCQTVGNSLPASRRRQSPHRDGASIFFPCKLALCVLLAMGSLAEPVSVKAQQVQSASSFDLPSGPLGRSLSALATQSRLQIIYTPELVAGRSAPALKGAYTAREALTLLLKGSDLVADFVDTDTAVLRKSSPRRASPPKPTTLSTVETVDSNITLDTIRVSAGYEPIEKKRDSAVIVESIHFDDIENAAIEESIASMLVQLPGVSSNEDYGEPRYIVLRGMSPDLNHTTVDGISIASVGEYGNGTRRVNLQLIPNDFSTRTDLFKTFTAEQDAGAIGGITDIVTRSAYDRPGRYFVADVFGIYSTYDGNDGSNSPEGAKSHWGKGLKSTFSDRFGENDQFGAVLSARYQSRVNNAGTVWQDTKRYYDDDGNYLSTPDRELGWNGLAVPYNYSYASYTDEIVSYGGSAKLEWKQQEDDLYGSLLLYSYHRNQGRTRNKFDVYTSNWVDDQSAEGGTSRINSMYTSFMYDTYSRNNRGALLRLDRKQDDSLLSFRAGYTHERYTNSQPYYAARTYPRSPWQYLDYQDSGDFLYSMTLHNPDILHSSGYSLSSARHTFAAAREHIANARLDYTYNIEPGDLGLGFASGLEWRRLSLSKDTDTTYYGTGMNINDYLYDPGYVQEGAGYSFPWIDYDAFTASALPGLTVNAADSAYNSRAADYKYTEDLLDGYVSLHYATDRTRYVLGLRYDDIGYDAFTPRIEGGTASEENLHNRGDYQHLLPSFNILHRLGDDLSLRFSYSHTLGRPLPSDVAQAESVSCGEDDDGAETCGITRGNPDLKPRRSRNLDVAAEKYFNGNRGLISFGYFNKRIRDDIFDLTTTEEIDSVVTRVTQPTNAEESSLQGLELAVMNRGMKIWGGNSLDASFNTTYMEGEMRFAYDGGTRQIDRMLEQPRWIANAALTWRIPQIRGAVRLWTNYRSKFLTSVSGSPWLDDGRDDRTTVNLSMWHRFGRDITLKYEFNNLFNNQPRALTGENLAYASAEAGFGRSVMLHLIYTPWSR